MKVTKEKASQPYRPSGTFGRTTKFGCCGTRTICYAATCSNSPRLASRFYRPPSAIQMGMNCQIQKQKPPLGERKAHTKSKKACEGAKRPHTKPLLIFAFDFGSPSPPPSSADWSGDVGEDCLSTWPRSGSCELRSRLINRATQGIPQGWRNWGRLLWVTFLGEARKVSSCRAAPDGFDLSL